MKNEKYYLGLDIGTNSVGYAVTNPNYDLIKFKGEPMWGTHVFEEGQQATERRSFRTARRRLDRRQQRVKLTQEIFASEIAKVDANFYTRISESALFRDETTCADKFAFFNDVNFTDKEFHKKYPTVHHLICELMNSKEACDVRLVYMAIAWLMAHRGHFLNEVDKNNIDGVLDFLEVYNSMMNAFEVKPWNCDEDKFAEILKTRAGITKKETLFKDLLFDGKKPKLSEDDTIDKSLVIKLLSGGKVSAEKLFINEEYAAIPSFSLQMADDEFAAILVQLGEDAEIVEKMRSVYDWALLADILAGEKSISMAKVKIYEQHKKDLIALKSFVKKYASNKYSAIFRRAGDANYVAYSNNEKSLKDGERVKKKANKETFCDYLKKELKGITPDSEDEEFYNDMIARLESYTFMPKQVNGNNRVIPYQLYWYELNKILQNAKEYLPFLNESSDGITNADKLLSVFEFRVPYYVGPLRKDNSKNAWIVRKAEGKIYPWNFEEKVDLDKSEEAFIDRLTNTCSYIPGADVLAKNSLLYCRFTILNEINNIKVNSNPIDVKTKQGIFGLFEISQKVSVKIIRDYLISNGCMEKNDTISGIDETIKSNYKPYHDFKRFIAEGILTNEQIEDIIKHLTYSEDKFRVRKYLEKVYAFLSKEDIAYISKLKYADFGRLSTELLTMVNGINKETGEVSNIIDALWDTNDNLMQLLSDSYTFSEEIKQIKKEYYADHPHTLEDMFNEMYISNSVKRPIYRTLDIVKEVSKVMGYAPEKVFVEMARGGGEKGKRTQSRRDKITELYKNYKKEEVRALSEQLEGKSDNELQSETLYLYFMQLGKCMYSGETLDITKLKTDLYNVDHIYPQSRVKDDSFDNKVLVLSSYNGIKSDSYPVPADWRGKMQGLWVSLKEKGLMSDEKYKRLTRAVPFTDAEKQNFINRQIVETRQSTKAIATILGDMFPDTEIVYVKAGLVSDFRHEFDIIKCRSINDLHHAKDAYLNIVCGNVYNSKFTKNFNINSDYSIKTKTIFNQQVKCGNSVVWSGKDSIAKIKKIVTKNNIHFTRYSFMRKGGFFDQMPVKAAEGLVERKTGLNTAKYGGYNKPTAACFMLARYEVKGKAEMMIVPVELLSVSKVLTNKNYAENYIRNTIATIENKPAETIERLSFPLGVRPLKINTEFSFDGFRYCLASKDSGGVNVKMMSAVQLKLNANDEKYVKKLESYTNKLKVSPRLSVDEKYDEITSSKNKELYCTLQNKLINSVYKKTNLFASQFDSLENGKELFEKLNLNEQVVALMQILSIFASCRVNPCDLSLIGKGKQSATIRFNSKISNWKKNYSDVRIVDMSASGLFEKETCNLFELL